MKKIGMLLVLILALTAFSGRPAMAAQKSYWENMKHDFGRGLKNVVSFPLEIPITIQEYHEKPGRPFIRHTAGFFDGFVQAVERLGSGLWDFAAMLVQGAQNGVPASPETLF